MESQEKHKNFGRHSSFFFWNKNVRCNFISLTKSLFAKSLKKNLSKNSNPHQKKVLSGRSYNYQCDVWSLGVALFRMITQKYPFGGTTADQVYKAIRGANPEWPRNMEIPSMLKKLVNGMLHKDPNRRLTMGEVVASDFVSGLPALS